MQLAPIYRAITTVTIGDGSSVLFWKDHWLFPSMADEFPRLYSYARDEDVSVQGLLTAASIGASFHLPLSAQAMEELRDMQVAAADVTMTLGSKDSWILYGMGAGLPPASTTCTASARRRLMLLSNGSGGRVAPISGRFSAGCC